MIKKMIIFFSPLENGFIAEQPISFENGVNLSGFYGSSYSYFVKNDLPVWMETFDEIIIYRKDRKTTIKREIV